MHRPKSICNWILGDISKCINEKNITIEGLAVTASNLAELFHLIEKGTISNAGRKKVFDLMLETKKMPDTIVKENNFAQISDENALAEIVEIVLSNNQKSIDDYRRR